MGKGFSMPAIFERFAVGQRRTDLLCLLAVALAGAVLYAHTLHVPWYMDDFPAIVENVVLRDLSTCLRQVFSRRGLALLTFALNYRLGGLDPAAYHLVNIGIHLATAGLVYLLLKRVFPGKFLYPLLGSMLFVAHPLQTQAVTYVVQRMTSLCGLFFFLCLYLFARAREAHYAGAAFGAPRHLGLYLGALLAGVLAVLTKENAAVLPFALLLFARFFLPASVRDWKPLLVYAAPFLLATAGLVVLQLLPLLLQGGSLSDLTNTQLLANAQHVSPLNYLVTEFSVLLIYLRLLLLPYGQALDHSYPVATSLLDANGLAALASLAALGWIAWLLRQRRPRLAFGITWFFLTLAIESSLIPLDPLFEHRLYLPMFGFAVVLTDLAAALPGRRTGPLLLGSIVLIFAILTWQRNALWNDQVAFYEDNLRKVPESERVMSSLANVYIETGRLQPAEAILKQSIAINPNHHNAYVNLLKLYRQGGRIDAGMALAARALQKFPDSEHLAMIAGLLYYDIGNSAEALRYLNKAVALNPHFALGYANIGRILFHQQRQAEAEAYLRKALTMNNDDIDVHIDLAVVLYEQYRLQEARSELQTVLRMSPGQADTLLLVGRLALELGDRATAAEAAARLRKFDPAQAAALERKSENAGR